MGGDLDKKILLNNVSMTSCADTSDGWELAAERIEIDDATKRGKAEKVKIKIFDQTFIKLPYLPFATSSDRMTGFLESSLSYSSDGLDFMIPYFKVISEKSDVTLAARNISERGFGFEGNIRAVHGDNKHLRNFDFIPEISNDEHSSRILTAARKALPKELDKRVNEFINSSEEALKLDNFGNILWMESSIGRLAKGISIYTPKVVLKPFDMLSLDQKTKIQKKCEESISKIINKTLASCLKLKNLDKIDSDHDDKFIELSSKVKAVNFHVFEGLGHTLVKNIPFQIQKINENDRLAIAKLGIRLGVNLIYLPIFLKPKIIKLKAILWSLYLSLIHI